MAKRILGIDLGTTNTCVAVVEDGKAEVIPNQAGARTTPSVVAYTEDGSILVGQPALRQAVINPKRTVMSIKRLMGLSPDHPEVEAMKDRVAYDIGTDEQGRVSIQAGVRDRTPIEISGVILKTIRTAAEEYFGEEIRDAIITCPAYFDDAQRQATHDAGRVAGLNVLRIINEPTAAALAFGWNRDQPGSLVVYDWGGGTFDCTVLECADKVFQVRSTRGDTFLGGNDIDKLLVDRFKEHFQATHNIEIGDDPVVMQRLREAAENAKIELSSVNETEVMLPFLASDESGPKHLELTVQRAELEGLLDSFIARTLECSRLALEDAKMDLEHIDTILVVGGVTKTPYVQEKLSTFFGKPPRRGVNPDEAVAMGAALQGSIIDGQDDDVLLIDVLPLSLGVAEGEKFSPMLFRNTPLPTFRTDSFETTRDHQEAVHIQVFQGEHREIDNNKLIGSFRLEPLPPLPAGQVRIDVTFHVNENGILKVDAMVKGLGLSHEIEVQNALKLSTEEIEKLRVDVDQSS
jgi:molecular chaperone DnaK